MFETYLKILREELVPAQGCTEPIALAFCSATAAKILEAVPDKLSVQVSGNIIKNVKSVIVPNTNGQKGIEAACVFGAIAGDAQRQLEVLSFIADDNRAKAQRLLQTDGYCTVSHLKSDAKLHMIVTAHNKDEYACVEIKNQHTNIIRIEKNNSIIFSKSEDSSADGDFIADRMGLSVKGIVDFAQAVPLEDIEKILQRQIDYNMAISNDGLKHEWGSNVGKTLLEVYGSNVCVRAKAQAAAGSDARMSGSVLPVVINSGSGNQGMTVSLPVIVYAEHIGASKERLLRALAISNLVAIHQKTKVGRLSAYCGAVSAAAGCGAGIAWLDGASMAIIEAAVINTLANVSGIICDGAKPSCAAKIASAVDAAFFGYELAKRNRDFKPGDGIVKKGVESTICSVGEIASKGMVQTDDTIIDIMLQSN